jgi:hypothetical protein
MGLLDGTTQNSYYTTPANYGNYQFTTLENIINAFMVAYIGENKLINKINRTDVQFHAMRAIQELSYDVFRSVKSQEIEVPATLTMILPHDYVNYVKLVRVGNDGIERVLYPTGKTSNPFPIKQNTPESTVDPGGYNYVDNDTLAEQTESNTWANYQDQTEADVYSDDATDIKTDNRGRRYGLDPQHAQVNGTFFIDQRLGFIHFGSALAGKTITLKYVSDGLGTDAEMVVHKFCEEACYKWIAYGILSTRSNMPEHIIQRFKREKFAETRKAKIRLSNIKMEEFTQILKGMSKQIK